MGVNYLLFSCLFGKSGRFPFKEIFRVNICAWGLLKHHGNFLLWKEEGGRRQDGNFLVWNENEQEVGGSVGMIVGRRQLGGGGGGAPWQEGSRQENMFPYSPVRPVWVPTW
jgi:hypothetical protein